MLQYALRRASRAGSFQAWHPAASKGRLCSNCYNASRPFALTQRYPMRPFHTSRPQRSPLIPLPVALLSLLKTSKLVSFVSLSSKTSLTLLPHTFYRDPNRLFAKLLASVPVMGFGLLLAVGLDQAPNTSRLRLVYLNEEEEEEIVRLEIDELLQSQWGLVTPRDNEYVVWLQNIVDNLARAAVDDVRDPIRPYDDEKKKDFVVDVICDASTINAMCAGRNILVYDLMVHYMDYDTDKMAVILSHEIAHSIQRHFVETHGIAALMFMLGDITRGVFWIVTESLGPYVNQKINEAISTFITMETQTKYNRTLEKEADLVGLKILAKAGYDPRIATQVWTKMAELDQKMEEGTVQDDAAVVSPPENKEGRSYQELETNVRQFIETLVSTWFGSSHPPSQERIEYMQAHMDEAVELYNEALRVNGPPKGFVLSREAFQEEQIQEESQRGWLHAMTSWKWPWPMAAAAQ